jgi:hypothetical protein
MLLAFLADRAKAQQESPVELFGGYSFVHVPSNSSGSTSGSTCYPDCPVGTSYSGHLNGWEGTFGYRIGGIFTLAADFGGTYGSPQGSKTRLHTFLAGPQARLGGKLSPFAHLFLGAGHKSVGVGTELAETRTGFAAAIGGGLDVRLSSKWSFCAISADYLLTRFNSESQNNFRISTGVTYRF